jgi:hypothetical protein
MRASFNSKEHPILNRLSEALDLLRECPDLDMVMVEDWLAVREESTSHSCSFVLALIQTQSNIILKEQ